MAATQIEVAPSSNVKAVFYDPDTLDLFIQFKDGLYHYQNIPGEVVTDFGNALSSGKYFNEFIKPLFGGVRVG